MQTNVSYFIFFSIYENRPDQCKNHEFHASKCPIGTDVMKIKSQEEANIRINKGYAMIKKGIRPLDKDDIWW